MLFNSFTFLLFFPIATLLYYLIPHKLRWGYLLLVSYGFYMNWNPSYALLLIGITLVSYIVGLSVERSRKRSILATGIIVSLQPLIVFKYMNFINGSVFSVLNSLGVRIQIPDFKLLLPVGISFFTFLLVKEICNEEGIEYFNFLNDKDFEDIKLYHTVDHLNSDGADKFTKKVAELLNK